MEILGDWQNQNGSVLSVTDLNGDHFTGVFVSKKGRAARDNAYPVSGVINAEIVTFCVNFVSPDANLHSITNFSGRLAREEGVDTMHTVWILARQFEDAERTKPTHPWNTFLTNSDVFRRVG